ncbi:hypothetical protein A0H81_11591 [Grifola frondosa]|uniref:Uncharacterized protein n=1 Tax=Grifola frondosa TaxID=5627 RepID=A0A1C7LVY5_GRIFR|nr:hypothetical protein A0H81_11591 [Grifola frondosa]
MSVWCSECESSISIAAVIDQSAPLFSAISGLPLKEFSRLPRRWRTPLKELEARCGATDEQGIKDVKISAVHLNSLQAGVEQDESHQRILVSF